MRIVKRILYYLLVIVLGFGITMIVGSASFNSQNKNLAKNEVYKQNYSFVESLFNYVMSDENEYFHSVRKDGIYFDAYPCLVKQPYYRLSDDENSIIVRYDIIEEAIGFSFFDLDKDFSYKDIDENRGRLELTLESGELIKLYFDNSGLEKNKINENINFYSYVEHYSSLHIYITYDDYISHGGSDTMTITKVELYDGKNVNYLSTNLSKPATFDTKMDKDYHQACQKYREYILKYGEAISVTTFERKDALLKAIDQITKDNLDVYNPKPSPYIIISGDKFILHISLTLSIYISIAIVITKAIFHRKRR